MTISTLALHGKQLHGADRLDRGSTIGAIFQSLLLVAIVTAALIMMNRVMSLTHVSTMYLVPVLFAATRWGVFPAISAAVCGVAASAFFFYPPLYDLRVSDPQQVMDLALFIGVAVVTGHLADSARAHMQAVEKSEGDVRALYTFSRRLAAASTVDEILAAAQDHLSAVLGYRVLLLQTGFADKTSAFSKQADSVPDEVRSIVSQAGQGMETAASSVDATGSIWMVRTVSHSNPTLGVVAMNLGPYPSNQIERLRQQVDAALTDVGATLERLDVARALDEARSRANREAFREALIGSVSHELRTPLSAILGAVSVLSQVVADDRRLSELVEIVRGEAENLDSEIQQMLDATRISSDGLHPQPAWTDPADLVNVPLEPHRRRAGGQQIQVLVPDELPLVLVDPVLVGRALRQIVDNAAKYSSPASTITVSAEHVGTRVAICVRDEGVGITADEAERLFERFYRSPRHQAVAAGSGLGLWIARSFVAACGGELSIESNGRDQGTIVTIYLPAPSVVERGSQDNGDE